MAERTWYLYRGDKVAHAFGSPFLGRRCYRETGWPWRTNVRVCFEDGTVVSTYWRCLRKEPAAADGGSGG